MLHGVCRARTLQAPATPWWALWSTRAAWRQATTTPTLPDCPAGYPPGPTQPPLSRLRSPAGPGKHATGPAAAAPTPTSEKAVPNGALPEGRAAKEHVGEVDDADSTRALRATKLARSALQERLAAGREKLDAEEMLWFRNSDAHVKRVNWEQVASCDPYLLMYVRTH